MSVLYVHRASTGRTSLCRQIDVRPSGGLLKNDTSRMSLRDFDPRNDYPEIKENATEELNDVTK